MSNSPLEPRYQGVDLRQSLVCLGSILLLACSHPGSGHERQDAGSAPSAPDAASEAGTQLVVESVTRLREPRAAPQLPEIAVPTQRRRFFAVHPLAQLTMGSGAPWKAPRVVGVFFGEDPLESETLAFLESYGCTSYWRDAVNEYGVGDLLYARSVHVPKLELDAVGDAGPDSQAFEVWIRKELARGTFGKVAAEELLLFFVPQGPAFSDLALAGGYHSKVGADSPGPAGPSYAVAFHAANTHDRAALDNRTFVASHELIEAVTDPDPNDTAWGAIDDGARAPTLPEAVWDQSFDNPYRPNEASDYCAAKLTPLEYPFTLARAYSDRGARAGLDPCNPGSPLPVMLALQGPAPAAGLDLSSRGATATLDVFLGDPKAAYVLASQGSILSSDGQQVVGRVDISAGGPDLQLRDGKPLALQLWAKGVMQNVVAAGALEVRIQACPATGDGSCYPFHLPVSAPPSLCPRGVYESDYRIGSVDDAALIAQCTKITGTLYLTQNADLESLSLPELATVGQGIVISSNPWLTSVSLPVLTTVGHGLTVGHNAILKSLSLPALTAADSIALNGNPELTSLDLRGLATISSLDIEASALTSLELPALTTLGSGLQLRRNPALTSVSLPVLTRAGATGLGVVLQTNALLTSVSLPLLETVGGRFQVTSDPVLSSLSLPRLSRVSGSLEVAYNGGLTSLALPLLTSVGGDFDITGNAALPTSQAEAVLGQLVGFKGTAHTDGNLP